MKRSSHRTSAYFGFPFMRRLFRQALPALDELQAEQGDLAQVRLLWERAYALFTPELVRDCLVQHAEQVIRQERGMAVFHQLHGPSVLVTEGAVWQRQHRILRPSFHPKRIAQLASMMIDTAAHALSQVETANAQGDSVVNVSALLRGLTLDVISRAMFGEPVGAQAPSLSEAVRELNERGRLEMNQAFSLPDALPLPYKRRKRRAMAVLHRFIDGHMAQRLQRGRTSSTGADLLDILLAAQGEGPTVGPDQLTPEEVRAQCMTVLLAGHDTSANALEWWMWLLSTHPAAHARCQVEVDAVLGQRHPDVEDVPNLPWITATLKEALRLYPPAPMLFTRRTLAPMVLGGRMVPARSLVFFSPWHVHRNSAYFERPTQFEPERFLPGAPELHRDAWMPFGLGPRVCIGRHFAMLEMQLLAAMLVQRFDWAQVPGEPEVVPQHWVTMRPAHDLRFCLRVRQIPR